MSEHQDQRRGESSGDGRNPAAGGPVEDRRATGFGKRIMETIIVASPVALVVMALTSGTVAFSWGAVFVMLGLAVLAVLTWTQKWPAYVLMTALAVVLLLDRGLLAMAGWAYAVVLLLIAVTNLVIFPLVNRRASARPSGTA